MTPTGRLEQLVVQMQSDFLDIPALNLTLTQAQERFDTDGATCEAVLGALVDARVLARTTRGRYVRFYPPRRADQAQGAAPAAGHAA